MREVGQSIACPHRGMILRNDSFRRKPRKWGFLLPRAGAAELTGLRSRDPILTTLDNRIGFTGRYHGIPGQELLRLLARRGSLLRSLGPLTVAGAATTQQGD